MINRNLIRIKTLQCAYSFYQGEKQIINEAEKELFFSINKSYELYHCLLYLPVEITRFFHNKIENNKAKFLPKMEEVNPNMKFVNNKFIRLIKTNESLKKYVSIQKVCWDPKFIKYISQQIADSLIYKEYMQSETSSYEEDKIFWRALYKHIIINNEELESILEEQSLFWNDDLDTIGSFVLKTFNRLDPEKGANQDLLPLYSNHDDEKFASELLNNSLKNRKEYIELIDKSTPNWDVNRIAFIDILILQIAIAELIAFPMIPLKVTFNEYLEIAKAYSTQKSSVFINGVLDQIARKLKEENKLLTK